MSEQNFINLEETKGELPPKITKETFKSMDNTKRGKRLYWTKTVLFLLLSSFLLSFAAQTLISANEFTIGGVGGIAILLNAASNGKIPKSIVIFSLNLPLIILSFFFVRKRFAVLTAAHILLQSLWLVILENVFPDFAIKFGGSGEKIFAAIASGLCVGASIALAFKTGGSTGGADIMAVILRKKFAATSLAWTLFMLNGLIIACSIFVYKGSTPAETLLPIMMSAFEAYIESKTIDAINNGFQSAIEFRIITDKPEEISNAIMRELQRGVTMLPATGMYTKEPHFMLLCVVNRRQIATLKRVIKRIDPDSFAVMANVSQVLGLGFYTDELQS